MANVSAALYVRVPSRLAEENYAIAVGFGAGVVLLVAYVIILWCHDRRVHLPSAADAPPRPCVPAATADTEQVIGGRRRHTAGGAESSVMGTTSPPTMRPPPPPTAAPTSTRAGPVNRANHGGGGASGGRGRVEELPLPTEAWAYTRGAWPVPASRPPPKGRDQGQRATAPDNPPPHDKPSDSGRRAEAARVDDDDDDSFSPPLPDTPYPTSAAPSTRVGAASHLASAPQPA